MSESKIDCYIFLKTGAMRGFSASHFVKSEFSEVRKMCNIMATVLALRQYCSYFKSLDHCCLLYYNISIIKH